MAKDSSFRILIALLLTIQILCWTLTLLDLFNPNKLRIIQSTAADAMRATTRIFAPLLSRRASGLLSYTQIYEMIDGLVG
ncbi:hypothetical protein NX059_006343 [Plenodomus lindquistii]|nr:hypothetical protein NX059_006343 [Plenodomus lindquistii]